MDVTFRLTFSGERLTGMAATRITVQEDERAAERVAEAVKGYLRQALPYRGDRMHARVNITGDGGGGEVYIGAKWIGQFQMERRGRR